MREQIDFVYRTFRWGTMASSWAHGAQGGVDDAEGLTALVDVKQVLFAGDIHAQGRLFV